MKLIGIAAILALSWCNCSQAQDSTSTCQKLWQPERVRLAKLNFPILEKGKDSLIFDLAKNMGVLFWGCLCYTKDEYLMTKVTLRNTSSHSYEILRISTGDGGLFVWPSSLNSLVKPEESFPILLTYNPRYGPTFISTKSVFVTIKDENGIETVCYLMIRSHSE